MVLRSFSSMDRTIAGVVVLVFISGCATPSQWPQWGGPNRNFMVETEGLADTWPESGPRKLWHRTLGDGYSTIVVDNDALYTMYRVEKDEFSVALDGKTGKTLWETKSPSPYTGQMAEFGPGPHATPLVVGNRLFTIGTNAVLHCLDKRDGSILWQHDLSAKFEFPVPGYGYAISPIAYKNTVIVPVDRERAQAEGESEEEGEDVARKDAKGAPVEQTLIAFDQTTGDIVWKSQDHAINYSSPILIDFDGEAHLVFLGARELLGVNPDSGELLWRHTLDPPGYNIATPFWDGHDRLFLSSAYDSGSRVIKLTTKDGKIEPQQLWYSRKMRIHHGNAVKIDGHIFASSGDSALAFFVGLNMDTGKVAWRKRGFKKATCVHGDGKLIILDEDGQLALTTATPDDLTVHSTCQLTENVSWTCPTLVGKTLYVRDRKHIMALDLG